MYDTTKAEKVIELATTEFQRFGFKAERIDTSYKELEEQTEVTVLFKEEIPTGIAAFSQSKVQNKIKYYTSYDTVYLSTSYEHHGGGSNGITRDYIIIENDSFLRKEPSYTLVPREVYALIRSKVSEEFTKRQEEMNKEV